MDPQRSSKTAIVESYLDCVVRGDLDGLPVTREYGSHGPRSGQLGGRAAIDYLGEIGREMSEIRVIRHVVEDRYVATWFDEVTAEGVVPVFALFELDGDRVGFVRVFFDSSLPGA